MPENEQPGLRPSPEDLGQLFVLTRRLRLLSPAAKSIREALEIPIAHWNFWAFNRGRWSGFAPWRIFLSSDYSPADYTQEFREVLSRLSVSRRSVSPFAELETLEELETVEKRLTRLERNVAALSEQRTVLKKGEIEKERQGKGTVKEQSANPDGVEDPPVKTAVVDSSSIAAAVRSHQIAKTSSWESISKTYPGVELFAIDADPRSFDVNEAGAFDGRADILVSVPKKTRTGQKTSLSLTIPVRVFGKLSPEGRILISDFKSSS
jgi:hypothetical protein